MEENVINEAPVTDAPAEDTSSDAPVADQSTDQATAEQAPQAEQAQGSGQEAPIQSDQEATNQDGGQDLSAWDSYLPKPAPSVQPTVGEDGFIDPVKYKEQIKSEVREEVRFERNEAKGWEKLEEKYPQLSDDSDLREIILAKRINDVQRGGDGSLIKSGETVMKKFGQARQEGKADQQVSVRRQKSAGVSRSTAPRNTSDKDVQQRIRSGDPNAIANVLSGWIDDGKI